jgi:hypothetical protein
MDIYGKEVIFVVLFVEIKERKHPRSMCSNNSFFILISLSAENNVSWLSS